MRAEDSKAFLYVAEYRNETTAVSRLNVEQSTVSRALGRLQLLCGQGSWRLPRVRIGAYDSVAFSSLDQWLSDLRTVISLEAFLLTKPA